MTIPRNLDLHNAVVQLVASSRLPNALMALQIEGTHLAVTATDPKLEGIELEAETCEAFSIATSATGRTVVLSGDQIPAQLNTVMPSGTASIVVGAIIAPTGLPLGFVAAYGPEPASESDRSRVQFSIDIIERHLDDKQENRTQHATGMSLKIASDKLQRYSEKLKSENENLDLFAEFTAHEVKNPLRAIMLCSDYLQVKLKSGVDGLPVSETVGLLAQISEEAQVLYDQIENILALGKPEPQYRRSVVVDLGDIVHQCLSRYAGELSSVNGRMEIGLMGQISCDPAHILMVLSNLVSNAIRYRSPNRDLVVGINYAVVDDKVLLTVSDNGIGISSENQERIFEAYTRCSSDVPGLGLGLALARRSLEQVGGSIDVDSEFDKGSIFTVTIGRNAEAANLQLKPAK